MLHEFRLTSNRRIMTVVTVRRIGKTLIGRHRMRVAERLAYVAESLRDSDFSGPPRTEPSIMRSVSRNALTAATIAIGIVGCRSDGAFRQTQIGKPTPHAFVAANPTDNKQLTTTNSPLKNSWHGLPGRDSCGVSDMGKMPVPHSPLKWIKWSGASAIQTRLPRRCA